MYRYNLDYGIQQNVYAFVNVFIDFLFLCVCVCVKVGISNLKNVVQEAIWRIHASPFYY